MAAVRKAWLSALVLLAAIASAFAASESDVNATIDRLLGDHVRYETTVKAFQQAVATNDREDVAAFVRYPIVVSIGGHRRTIGSSEAFIRAYDQIMTPDIVDAVKMQKYEDLFVNDQGLMLGSGEIWLHAICLDRSCKRFVPKVVTIQHAGTN